MQVLHISYTPVVGAPIMISDALNQYTDIHSRTLVLEHNAFGQRNFRYDLSWQKQADKQEAQALIEQANVLHFHHYINPRDNAFGIDFIEQAPSCAKMLVQYHSAPALQARDLGVSEQAIQDQQLHSLVTAQAMERFYPHARKVPNILPVFDEKYSPKLAAAEQSLAKLVFSPSTMRRFWTERWATKGAPQIIGMAKQLQRAGICQFELINNLAHIDCLRIKQSANLGIDDLFTGGFHLSGLEFLSMGIATLNYLDERSHAVLSFLTGSNSSPFINLRWNERQVLDQLQGLCANLAELKERGTQARAWMLEYYDPAKLVLHYQDAYKRLLELEQFNLQKWLEDQQEISSARQNATYWRQIEDKWPGNRILYNLARGVAKPLLMAKRATFRVKKKY